MFYRKRKKFCPTSKWSNVVGVVRLFEWTEANCPWPCARFATTKCWESFCGHNRRGRPRPVLVTGSLPAIKLVDQIAILLIDHRAFHFQRWRHLAFVNREFF